MITYSSINKVEISELGFDAQPFGPSKKYKHDFSRGRFWIYEVNESTVILVPGLIR